MEVMVLQWWLFFAVDFAIADITNVADWSRNGDTYYYFGDDKSFPDAIKTLCETRGANPVSILNGDEQTFIQANRKSTAEGYYIGLRVSYNDRCDDCKDDQDNDCTQCRNKWKWDDNSISNYQNWQNDQPNSQGRRCARLDNVGQWKTAGCSGGSGYRYVCKRSDPCNPTSPCQNGNCEMIFSTRLYECHCNAGYTGRDCQTEINECDGSPCKNGGTCNDLLASYECTCPNNWTGGDCDEDVDECQNKQLCKNGATCRNSPGSFRCNCSPGFTGTYCEIDINECDPRPCKNGATCHDNVNIYTCTCTKFWEGPHCDEDIDECSGDNQQNYCVHGTCTNEEGGYNCSCKEGYEGQKCDRAIGSKVPDDDAGNLQVLTKTFAVAASLFGVSFIVMMVMLVLDCRDVKRLERREAAGEGLVKASDRNRSASTDQPSTSGAYANIGNPSSSAVDSRDVPAKLEAMYANMAKDRFN